MLTLLSFPLVSEGSQYDRRVVRPKLLTTVGDEKGEGNVEGETVVTESYVFLDKSGLEDREWDFAEFKSEKLKKWTHAGYVFAGECSFCLCAEVPPPPHLPRGWSQLGKGGGAAVLFYAKQVELTMGMSRLRAW